MVDFFTKPLPAKTFFFMRDKIMNVYGLDAVRHLTSFPSEGCTVQASLGTLEQIRVRRTIAQEGGKAGAIAYLSSMKADYDHTMQHGPDNAPTKSVPATIPLESQHDNSTLTKHNSLSVFRATSSYEGVSRASSYLVCCVRVLGLTVLNRE